MTFAQKCHYFKLIKEIKKIRTFLSGSSKGTNSTQNLSKMLKKSWEATLHPIVHTRSCMYDILATRCVEFTDGRSIAWYLYWCPIAGRDEYISCCAVVLFCRDVADTMLCLYHSPQTYNTRTDITGVSLMCLINVFDLFQ